MRTLAIALGLAFGSAAHASEPILVPEFTPSTQAEFTVAVMLQGMVVDRLTTEGYIVLSQEMVAPVVGEQAVVNCSAQPTCPQAILPKLPSRIAVVVRVERVADGLSAHLELYEQSRPTPVVADDIALPPGSESALANDIAAAVGWLVGQIGPSPEPVIAAAARLMVGQDPSAAPPPAPVPKPAPVPAPAPVPTPQPQPQPQSVAQPAPRPAPIIDIDGPAPKNTTPARAGDVAQLGEETGVYPRHVAGSEEHWRNSGMDPRDWVYKQMPHAGRVAIEVRAGIAMGDVDRVADLRVEVLNANNEIGQSWYQEGPDTARRPRGALYVGYAPTTFFDFGILGGLQYGKRYVSTGYVRLDPEDPTAAPQVNKDSYPPVDAVQLYVQPRLRGYLVPIGPAKPYVFAGGDVRVFNVYELQQPDQWTYPLPPGAIIGGAVGGGGLMLDPSPIVGFFFEGSYTQHFGQRAEAVLTSAWTYENLPVPVGVGYTIGLVGGVQFRI